MKKLLFLFVAFAVLFTACDNVPKNPDTPAPDKITEISSDLPEFSIRFFSDMEWSDKHSKTIAELSYEELILSDASKEKFPELSDAIEEMNSDTADSYTKEYEEICDYAKEDPSIDSEYFYAYNNKHNLDVIRADKKVVSVLHHSSSYSGGAHGYSGSYGRNFDTETGEELELSDIITDMDELPDIIEDEIERWRNEDRDYFNDFTDISEYADTNELNWFIGYDGITFIFNPYEIAPYAAGKIVAPVLFEDYPDIFNEEYFDITGDYCSEIPEGMNIYTDIDGDGEVDEFSVYPCYSEYDMYEEMAFKLNGTEYKAECGSYDIHPTLVHLENGKTLIYINYDYENGDGSLGVFEYEDGEFNQTKTLYLGNHIYLTVDGEYQYDRLVISDPECFRLADRTATLGTAFATIKCFIDNNGYPDSDETMFVISDRTELEVLTDTDANIIDEKTGKVLKKTTIKEGETVEYYRTDNETKADLILENGQIARIELSSDDWPVMVGDKEAEDVFKGLVWAG